MRKLIIMLMMTLMFFSIFAITGKDLDNACNLVTLIKYDRATRQIKYELTLDGVMTTLDEGEFNKLFKSWKKDLQLVSYHAHGGEVKIECQYHGRGGKEGHKIGRKYIKTYAETH